MLRQFWESPASGDPRGDYNIEDVQKANTDRARNARRGIQAAMTGDTRCGARFYTAIDTKRVRWMERSG